MEKKKYYAFISYSHDDSELAKWLQHELEYYQLPSTLNVRDDFEELQKSFRPVFRDEDELSGGDLTPQISKALADSNYLIVVCSPNAVASKYVDKEIQEFISLSTNNKRRIFPIIIDGKPHQDEEHKENECFPITLRKISEDKSDPVELIAGDIHATGRDHAFVQVLAGTLKEKDISFAELWDRYAKEKAEKEQKEREEKEKLQIAQSRFLAEKANNLLEGGDSFLSRKLLLEVLPHNVKSPTRPLVEEAETAFVQSCLSNSAIFRGHKVSISFVAIIREGSRVVSVSNDGYVCVWNSYNGNLIFNYWVDKTSKYFELHPNECFLVFAPERGLYCLNLKSGEINRLGRLQSSVSSMSFTKEGLLCVTFSNDKTIRYWDVCTNVQKKVVSITSFIDNIIYSHDGKCLASSCGNVIQIRDASSYEIIKELIGHTSPINSIRYSHNGDMLVSSSNDNTIRIWNLRNNTTPLVIVVEEGTTSVAVQHSKVGEKKIEKKILTKEVGDTAQIWHVVSSKKYKNLEQKMIGVKFADFTQDDSMVVGILKGGQTIFVWDIQRGGQLFKKKSFDNSIITFSLCKDNSFAAFGFDNGELLLDQIVRKTFLKVERHIPGITNAVLCPNNKRIAVVNGHQIMFISTIDGSIDKIINAGPGLVTSVSFSSDVRLVCAMSSNKTIYVWDVNTSELLWRLKYGLDSEIIKKDLYKISRLYDVDEYIDDVIRSNIVHQGKKNKHCFSSISPNGMHVAAIYGGKDITVFDRHKKTKKILKGHTGIVQSLVYSPDGKCIASSSSDKTIRVWNANSGTEISCHYGHTANVCSVAYSIDGYYIASASEDKTIRVWKNGEEQSIIVLTGHSARVNQVRFSSSGKFLISASDDKTVRIWELETGECLFCYKKHDNVVYSADFFSNENYAMSISKDGSFHVWEWQQKTSLQRMIDETLERFKDNPLTLEERREYYLV